MTGTVYVDVDRGADTNEGSKAHPFKTVDRALEVCLEDLQKYDTVMVEPVLVGKYVRQTIDGCEVFSPRGVEALRLVSEDEIPVDLTGVEIVEDEPEPGVE